MVSEIMDYRGRKSITVLHVDVYRHTSTSHKCWTKMNGEEEDEVVPHGRLLVPCTPVVMRPSPVDCDLRERRIRRTEISKVLPRGRLLVPCTPVVRRPSPADCD